MGCTIDIAARYPRVSPVLLEGFVGLALGYLVLHPVVMVIFAVFGTHVASGSLSAAGSAFISSFSPSMVPMALAFSLLAAALGALDGAYRVRLKQEERRLAQQLERTRIFRERAERRAGRIAELEEARKNQSLFLVHDLKTHASCVMGYAQCLMSAKPPLVSEQQRDAVGRIYRQAARILDGALDLLDLDRLESGAALDACVLAPSELIASALERAGFMPGDACVIVTEGASQCPPMNADRDLLERAVANLLRNAIRHNTAGVKITLDAFIAANGEDVIVICEDNGRGFNRPRLQAGASDRSARRSSTDSEPSYGLGLRFCQAVAVAHHGRFGIVDAVPHGTRAELRIPRACDQGQLQ